MSRIEDALELLDLRDWIEQYDKTQTVGKGEFSVQNCPKCLNSKYKLYVNENKRLWYCQRCAFGQHIRDLSVLLAEVSGRSLQDIRLEMSRMVIPSVGNGEYDAELSTRLQLFDVWNENDDLSDLVLPMDVPGNTDFSTHTGKLVTKYAASRGLSPNVLELFQLRCTAELKKRIGPYLVFPVIYEGSTVAWQGRRTTPGNPKYISSDNIGNWLWPFDTEYVSLLKTRRVVLVEGVFDALGCMAAGVVACCTFGKHVTPKQLKLLKDHGIVNVMLGWDAGTHKDIVRAVDDMTPGFDVKILSLDVSQDDGKVDLGDALTNPALYEAIYKAVDNAIDAHSSDYWTWRLAQELG